MSGERMGQCRGNLGVILEKVGGTGKKGLSGGIRIGYNRFVGRFKVKSTIREDEDGDKRSFATAT